MLIVFSIVTPDSSANSGLGIALAKNFFLALPFWSQMKMRNRGKGREGALMQGFLPGLTCQVNSV